MFLKQLPQLTITELIEQEAPRLGTSLFLGRDLGGSQQPAGRPIRIGDEELPATGEGLIALGNG